MSTANQDESDILQVEGVLSKVFGFAPQTCYAGSAVVSYRESYLLLFLQLRGRGKDCVPKGYKNNIRPENQQGHFLRPF